MNKNVRIKFLLAIIALMPVLSNNVYAQKFPVGIVSVQDTTQAYDLALTLRHTEQYAYQNLWLFVSACDSLSPLRADTVLACLADDRGRWLSTRTGRYYAGYVTMQHAMRFPAAGTYTFAIVQGMRDSVITGIADVGLELKQSRQP